MGYDLTNTAGDYHQWKVLGWWQLLNLATEYGWQPAGTKIQASTSELWNGSYFQNSGQAVDKDDAIALAEALDHFLADPRRAEVAQEVAAEIQRAIEDHTISASEGGTNVKLEPLEYIRAMLGQFGKTSISPWDFDERSNDYLRSFIIFCRKGAFRIE